MTSRFNQFLILFVVQLALLVIPVSQGISQVFDLALVLEETSIGSYATGDQVNHTITVCNQGNFSAYNVEIVDYIPEGMTLSQSDGNDWLGPIGGPVTNKISAIPAGLCSTLDIVLTVGSGVTSASLVNEAEIISDNGNDVDSHPDVIKGNDAGGVANTPSDNTMFGNGTGSPGDGIGPTDEDDHDPEHIEIDPEAITTAMPADPMLGSNNGDIFIGNSLNGIILTSPDGTCYRLRVKDGGSLSVEALACP